MFFTTLKTITQQIVMSRLRRRRRRRSPTIIHRPSAMALVFFLSLLLSRRRIPAVAVVANTRGLVSPAALARLSSLSYKLVSMCVSLACSFALIYQVPFGLARRRRRRNLFLYIYRCDHGHVDVGDCDVYT